MKSPVVILQEYIKSLKSEEGEVILIHVKNSLDILKRNNMEHDYLAKTITLIYPFINNFNNIDFLKIIAGDEKLFNYLKDLKFVLFINCNDEKHSNVKNLRNFIASYFSDYKVVASAVVLKCAELRHILTWNNASKNRKEVEYIENIFLPIADKIGLYSIKKEMEILILNILRPDKKKEIEKYVARKKADSIESLNKIFNDLKETISFNSKIDYQIESREKRYYSIYKKILEKNKKLEDLFDIFGFRFIVNTLEECYEIFAILISKYKIITERTKDYILSPKDNGYQSVHLILISEGGLTFEVQIRTKAMDYIAKNGVAAHWEYKRNINVETSNNNDIFIFTSNFDILKVGKGYTALDCVFVSHGIIALKCFAVKINGKICALEHKISNGDKISIETRASIKPSRKWLEFLQNPRAIEFVNNYFREQNRIEIIEKGREIVRTYFFEHGIHLDDKIIDQNSQRLLNKNNSEDVYTSVANNEITTLEIYRNFFPEHYKVNLKKIAEDRLIESINTASNKPDVKNNKKTNLSVKIAKCCNPISDDTVVGVVNNAIGISIHKKDCVNLANIDSNNERRIDIDISNFPAKKASQKILLKLPNKIGSIMNVVNIFNKELINILSINTLETKLEYNTIEIIYECTNKNISSLIKEQIECNDGFFII